jgi:iron(III) transport system substrate-binding protein
MQRRDGSWFATVATLLCLGMIALLSWSGGASHDALVVYCSHDSVYSEEILRDFELQTGIRLIVRFDTEATKSIGLINLLIAERDSPQCDVFWNNEVLGTMKLQELGLLQPYKGDGFRRIPARYKADDGSWAGFAARLRVFIVNTENMTATRAAVAQRLNSKSEDLSRVAMAKPLFGTTLTQYSAVWSQMGPDELKRWHRSLRDRGLLEVNGNSVVKDLVASGRCDFGFTDTDDFFLAADDRKPVRLLPVVFGPPGGTICIPNSVAIIRGTKRSDAARRLVDYLLSAEVETRLACSPSRQIPLGPVNVAELPIDVQLMISWAEQGIDLKSIRDSHADCLEWLQSEYLQ